MTMLFRTLALSTLTLLPQLSFAVDDPHLYGCFFLQSREPGEWVTSTKALFIEKNDGGILLHGSVSSWKNSWISTPDDKSPVPLKKISDRQFLFKGQQHPDKTHARCELVLRYDTENIYIKKYDSGCKTKWNTGHGIGPSEMSFANKQSRPDMCLGYLGIIRSDKKASHLK